MKTANKKNFQWGVQSFVLDINLCSYAEVTSAGRLCLRQSGRVDEEVLLESCGSPDERLGQHQPPQPPT